MQVRRAAALFLEGYFSTCSRSPRTITAYQTDLRQFLEAVGPRTRLENIGPEELERWAFELRGAGYAPTSVRRKLAALKVLFKYWVRRGVLERSPFWQVRLDLGRHVVLPRVLSLQDMRKLLRQAKAELGRLPRKVSGAADERFLALRNLAMVEVLFATGIRVGELTALTVEDFRSETGILRVKGKGSRERIAMLPDSRSLRVARCYVDQRKGMCVETSALFLNVFERPLSTQGVATVVTRLAQSAGIPMRVTPHMLRHTVATLLLKNGADIRVVQEFLGHASITTTQRYTHVTKEHLAATLRRHHPNVVRLAQR